MPARHALHDDASQADLFACVEAHEALEANDPVEHAHQSVKRWVDEPVRAFREWKLSKRTHDREFSKHSVAQYESMFGAYLRWLGARSKNLSIAATGDVDCFLEAKSGRKGKSAAATTRRRYLYLIHGVHEHLRELALRADNPVEPLVDLTRHQAFERPAPTMLPLPLTERYIAWVDAQAPASWVDVRDKALRLVFLAAGISVAELQALRPEDLGQISGEVSLNVVAHGFAPTHAAPVASFARSALLDWAEMLKRIAPESQWLFPARNFGFGIDKPDTTPVSSPECYTIVQSALHAIGYERARQGPQTLRNSYVARQVWAGKPHAQIAQWLGLHTQETVQKVARLVGVRRDGVAPV